MQISVSIQALYTYSTRVFDGMRLPEGVDRDILIPELVSECSDFCLVYPDFDYMCQAIKWWSSAEFKVWEAMQRSVELEYNPIENYDRYEDIKREVKSRSGGKAKDVSSSSSESHAETVLSKTAFNTDMPKEAQRSSDGGSGSDSGTRDSETKNRGKATETISSHVHGNIGVTTAAQMIEGYRSISDFTVYRFIIDSFKRRFCIEIY